MRDALGRVLLSNDQDLSVYASTMDIYHWALNDRRTTGLVLIIIFLIFSTITTGLRIYTRTKIIRASGVDDYFMVASQLAFFAYCGFQTAELIYGTGWHRYQITMPNAELALKYWLLCAIAYAVATSLIKITIGLLLLRFTTHRIQTWCIWAVMIATGVIGGGYFVFLFLTCAPFSFFWDLDPIHTGYCFSPAVWLDVGYFVAACNTLADAAFAVIPGVIVFRTTMTLRTKFGAYALLCVGSIAVIATALRINYGQSFRQYKAEFMYDTAPIALLSTVEVGLGIIAANLATFRPLFRAWRPKKLSLHSSRHRKNHGGHSNIRVLGGAKARSKFDPGSRGRIWAWVSSTLRLPRDTRSSAYVTTLSGQESIYEMPDLILLKMDDVDVDVEAGKAPGKPGTSTKR